MYLNQIKIFFRNSIRQLYYSILNISGLAIGIAASFVILVYVLQEMSYEKSFPDNARIYRVATKFMTMGEFAKGPEILLETSPRELPWIEASCRVDVTDLEMTYKDHTQTEVGLIVEENFFDIFQYQFNEGSSSQALLNLNSIVLSKELAGRRN